MHAKFVTPDVKFRFTCEEWNLSEYFVKFQVIMKRIVVKYKTLVLLCTVTLDFCDVLLEVISSLNYICTKCKPTIPDRVSSNEEWTDCYLPTKENFSKSHPSPCTTSMPLPSVPPALTLHSAFMPNHIFL